MRWRVVLALSVGLNAVLAFIIYSSWRTSTVQVDAPLPPAQPLVTSSNTVKTNIIVRRLHFKWDDVESDDYATYIANLREVACPESTIRDIIVAEVNQLYAKRKAAEIVSPDQQWWRSDPDPATLQAASKKLDAIEKERRNLLASLLGADWENSTERTIGDTPLTGPVLGSLPKETKQAVQQISARAAQRLETLFDARAEGKPIDEAELNRVRQQTREELARVLSPEQLEEYLLRYSQNANTLRNELRGVNVTPEEFRALFRARDPVDQQLNYSGTDPGKLQQRSQLEQQEETSLQTVLGPERYQTYRLNKDPLYREAKTTVEKFGAPAEIVAPIYRINQLTEAARERIRNNVKLSPEQKSEVLKIVQEEQQRALLQILGKDLFESYEEDTAE